MPGIVGLTDFKIIPAIENSDKPTTCIELINQAQRGKDKPVNGKYRHEIYKEAMDKFLARHGDKKARQPILHTALINIFY